MRMLVFASILMLSACAAPKPEPIITDPRAVWCAENSPERPSEAEIAVMPIERKRAIVEHNRKGVAWCGWEP